MIQFHLKCSYYESDISKVWRYTLVILVLKGMHIWTKFRKYSSFKTLPYEHIKILCFYWQMSESPVQERVCTVPQGLLATHAI